MIFAVPIMVVCASVILLVFLVALKVRSSGSKKAPHSTLRRTLLHHLQTLAILLSLNVKWPDEVLSVVSWLSSVVSTSDHMATLKCSHAVANKFGTKASPTTMLENDEAKFFYTLLVVFLLLPLFLSSVAYVYWVFCAQRFKSLRCGVKLHAEHKKSTRSNNNGNAETNIELVHINETMVLSNNPGVLVALPALPPAVGLSLPALPGLKKRSETNASDVTNTSSSTTTSEISVSSSSSNNNRSSRSSNPAKEFQKSPLDCAISTAVLILYLFYPSLVRMAFSVLECEQVCNESWLERDQHELCWTGRHLDYVLFVSCPSIVVLLILLPGISTWFLFKRRTKLYKNKRMTFRFGMLYSGYRLVFLVIFFHLCNVSI